MDAARGLALALLALALAAPAAHADSPFEWRGIVEGPYGRPWDHGQRERILRWMPSHGFNAYVHAPKDDLYQRSQWREPYPETELREYQEEIRLARDLGVQWIPNLSPAAPLIPSTPPPGRTPSRDLCFSCPSDLQAVVAKLEPFYEAGARTMMISFDDVSKVMSHPEDAVAYGVGDEAFGRANGDFLNRLYDEYAKRPEPVRLLTVGADYSGTSDTPYLRGLRSVLRPEVDVMWTGTSIPAQDWGPEEARAYGELIGRRPLVWENWTNNDTAGNFFEDVGTARIFLGAYRRRADVAGELRGFFFNPMNEADLNMLPLATAGDWMRDPAGFRRLRSWRRAVNELAGRGRGRRGVRAALRAWAETSWSHKLEPQDAPTFVARSSAFLDAYRAGGRWLRARRTLLYELGLVERAETRLRRLRNRGFFGQAKPFIESARQSAAAGRLGAELLEAERPSLSLRTRRRGPGRRIVGRVAPPDPERADRLRSSYGDAKTGVKANPRMTYGWRGGVAFEVPPYEVPRNTMDVFFDNVDALDSSWDGERASSGVTLTRNGRPVRVDPAGRFRLGRRACGHRLLATDGAGGQTERRVRSRICRRRR